MGLMRAVVVQPDEHDGAHFTGKQVDIHNSHSLGYVNVKEDVTRTTFLNQRTPLLNKVRGLLRAVRLRLP